MKWLPFAILGMLFVVLQTTVVQQMSIRSIWPELTFILVVHYALWGRWPDAAIACWILGLAVDLLSGDDLDPIGLHAFGYGAAAWGIIRIRQVLFRDHPATHVLVTLVFALGLQLLIALVRWWKLSGSGSTDGLLWAAVLTAVYTALLAPCLHWPLQKIGRWTGLSAARRYALHR